MSCIHFSLLSKDISAKDIAIKYSEAEYNGHENNAGLEQQKTNLSAQREVTKTLNANLDLFQIILASKSKY